MPIKYPKRKPSSLKKKRPSGFGLLPPERRREIARRGHKRSKEVGGIHVFTEEDTKNALAKRWGTLPKDHPSNYTSREKKQIEQAALLQEFLDERAKMFGRERNLPIGANRIYEKNPCKETNGESPSGGEEA